MRGLLCPLLIPILVLVQDIQSQRLSNGASDWYMRFHDFNMVKRNAEAPVIRSFYVESSIRYRFSRTTVYTIIHNPAKAQQPFKFGFAMPSNAFISHVDLESLNEESFVREHIKSTVKYNDWVSANKEALLEETSKMNSGSNGNDSATEDSRDSDDQKQRGKMSAVLPKNWLDGISENTNFKQFILPLNLPGNATVALKFVYENMVVRTGGKYYQILSISPGQLVKDFRFMLRIEEARPIKNVNISAPVIGDILTNSIITKDVDLDHDVKVVEFNMTYMDQYNYFGIHGFTGDIEITYDVDLREKKVDYVVEGDYFIHFYDVPDPLSSIPKHVIFLLDTAISMTGPKMEHAKDAIGSLLRSLDMDDHVNMLIFDENVRSWQGPNSAENETFGALIPITYPANDEITENILASLEPVSASHVESNVTKAVDAAIELDDKLWQNGLLTDNTVTMLILVTDGRSDDQYDEKRHTRRKLRQRNRVARIPFFVLGMGFDANMNFLEKVAAKSGALAVNVIEDLDVDPQIQEIKVLLKDVILKNVNLRYIGEDTFDHDSITDTSFKAFRKGDAFVIAGKLKRKMKGDSHSFAEFEVEVTAQSANGLFMELPPASPLYEDIRCDGEIVLCNELHLEGKCLRLNMSRANLREFGFSREAASLNVTGDCLWLAYKEPYYDGEYLVVMPGYYDAIPAMHKAISSIKRLPLDEFKDGRISKDFHQHLHPKVRPLVNIPTGPLYLNRVWAYMRIRDTLQMMESKPDSIQIKDIIEAAKLAHNYHFLTPFTDMYLVGADDFEEDYEVEPGPDSIVHDNYLSFMNLHPLYQSLDDPEIMKQWKALKSCNEPVNCEGNFHFEERPELQDMDHGFEGENIQLQILNCTGTVTVYTKPNFHGENLTLSDSVFQLYHEVNSQRFRSVATSGRCCWLFFDRRFYSGKVNKMCGDEREELRLNNIGSIKRIGPRKTPLVKGVK